VGKVEVMLWIFVPSSRAAATLAVPLTSEHVRHHGGEPVSVVCVNSWPRFRDVVPLLAGPAKSRRDDLLAKRDGLRQQQAAAEGQLESQLK
jgi:hypothetical protein